MLSQCKLFDIPILTANANTIQWNAFDLIVDALFGFSFKPPIRPPFDWLIDEMNQSKVDIVSIDIPSGRI